MSNSMNWHPDGLRIAVEHPENGYAVTLVGNPVNDFRLTVWLDRLTWWALRDALPKAAHYSYRSSADPIHDHPDADRAAIAHFAATAEPDEVE